MLDEKVLFDKEMLSRVGVSSYIIRESFGEKKTLVKLCSNKSILTLIAHTRKG